MRFKLGHWLCGSALAAGFGAGPAWADEFRAGVGGWRYDLTGTANDAGTLYDFERDLAIVPDGRRSLALAWDTPRGWWPDVALSYSEIGAQGMREVTTGLPPFTVTRTIAAEADYDDYDLTVRYPLRRHGWIPSVGLTLKRLRGDILIDDSDQAQPSQQAFDELFPMAHVQLRRSLGRVLALVASGQGVEYQGDKALEYRVVAELRLFQPLLVEIGWQEKRYDITVENYALDARLRGGLLRVGLLLGR